MCFSQPAYLLDQEPVTTVQSCLLRMIAIGILLPRSPRVDNRSRKIQTSSSFETCFLSIKNSPRGDNSHRSRRNVSISAQAPALFCHRWAVAWIGDSGNLSRELFFAL